VNVLSTARLTLRELDHDDDTFILELLNEPGFLRYIGEKGVRTAADARQYITQGPRDSYARHGYGLYATCLGSGPPLGMCGLVRREGLEHADLGFAFLERHWGRGYAVEAAGAVLDWAFGTLKLPRVVAITSLDNLGSIAVLTRVGLTFERLIRLRADGESLRLFGIDPPERLP
jgi:ribosomal-protein-alanine N-acetyltransferase